jgi:hypothetical protein
MNELWVLGGAQRESLLAGNEWRGFHTAVVARVGEGGARRVFEYRTPADRRPPGEGSHCFKAATFLGSTAYLCTDTEVLVCDFPGFAIRRVISLPCFNDLHHVTRGPSGTLWVAVTGLDAVAEVTPEGELVRLHDVLGGDPWERFSPATDYRRVPSTKPHRAHPNYVFFLDGRPWVTRFEQRDAVPLERPVGGEGRLAIGGNGPHDGQVEGGRVHFTSVDGRLVSVEPESGARQELDLNPLAAEPGRPLGWCRGLLVDGDRAWVGFTRLRFTALRQNLSWVRHGFRESPHRAAPARVALYDLRRPALLREVPLEEAGIDAVFSVHAAAPEGSGA